MVDHVMMIICANMAIVRQIINLIQEYLLALAVENNRAFLAFKIMNVMLAWLA
jgi:hypothetical protein